MELLLGNACEPRTVRAGAAPPERGHPEQVRKHQVHPAIAIHINRVDRACERRVQRLAPKLQPSLVPEQGGGRMQPRQDDIGEAVGVEIGQRHAGAVAEKKANAGGSPLGDMRQPMGLEGVDTRTRVPIERL